MRFAGPVFGNYEASLLRFVSIIGLLFVPLTACEFTTNKRTISVGDMPRDSVSNLAAFPGDSVINVSWTNPEHNNINQFNITWTDTTSTRNMTIKLTSSETNVSALARVNYPIENLINGHNHTLQVTVIYETGRTVPSAILRRTPGMNTDGDEYPDSTDEDDDNDGINDFETDGATPRDNCRTTVNPRQVSSDGDDIGDACDPDDDNDGIPDFEPDGITPLDLCPTGEIGWTSSQTTDYDGDGCRDSNEDPDDDNDGIPDFEPDGITPLDLCPTGEIGWTSSQTTDYDGDGCRDSDEDPDDDNDGVNDLNPDGTPLDACARNATDWTSNQTTDHDGDGCRDSDEDPDDDNDGIPDFEPDGTTPSDNCRTTVNPKQTNFDGDALGDACDPDDDNDGYADDADADDNNNSLIDIRTLDELARMRDDLNGDGRDDGNIAAIDAIGDAGCPVAGCIGYELLRSLNFSDANSYAPGSRNMALWTNGSGWTPIGSCVGGGMCPARRYMGIFDGNHHNLSNLFIAAAGNIQGIGLFSATNGTLRNLRLLAANISGGNTYVGTLAGYGGRNTRLENILVSGTALKSDATDVGGLAGYLEESEAINTAVIHSNITGSANVGGLVGQFQGRFTIPAGSPAGRRPWLNTSYALNNDVSGEINIGGLVGLSGNLDIDNSYAAGGRVSGTGGGISTVGGLIGHGQYGTGEFVWVENSYAALDSIVSPTLSRAGFVFPNQQALPFFNINNSYWNNDTMDIPANTRLPEQMWQRTTDQLQTPTRFTDSIYTAWANFWCKPGTSEVRESGTQPAEGFVRVWDLGNATQYPAIRCTPGGVAIQRP